MTLLPSKSIDQQAGNVLPRLKKGDTRAFSDFIWQYLERCYAVSFLACHNQSKAEDITLQSFGSAFDSLAHTNLRQMDETVWEWFSQFVVQACADFHASNPGETVNAPGAGGGLSYSQEDWDKTIILGVQRVNSCLSSLPAPHREAFVLRHQLDLGYEQISKVLNCDVDTAMGWLYLSREELVKCLSQK
jgi:DNA-directed RNA polymerase specialized sigma24 family protein